jgi:hypothetical protein
MTQEKPARAKTSRPVVRTGITTGALLVIVMHRTVRHLTPHHR